ncbi:MAG: molybdopterin molybdotransferase MoeA [Desulfovibrio sp.]|nr:molybdopterin molybdotransferase MoeA [Desulfovibrio sp.]
MRESEELSKALLEITALPKESVNVSEALGWVLACDVRAPMPWPPHASSTRDGYAVRAQDIANAHHKSVLLHRVGESRVAELPCGRLKACEAWRVVTGSILPEGADCVVMQEDVCLEGDNCSLCRITTPEEPGKNILARGSDINAGEVLVQGNCVLGPAELALLAQFYDNLPVRRRPVMGILGTGDEFCKETTRTVLPTNAVFLASLGQEHGACVRQLGTVADDFAKLRDRLLSLVESGRYDLLVLFGGSSQGPHDQSAKAIASLPGCRLYGQDQIVSSGRPLVLARAGTTWLWGFPGHVFSQAFAARLFLVPMLRRMQGREECFADTVLARMGVSLGPHMGEMAHYPVMLQGEGRVRYAYPILAGSGKISFLRDCDGWVTLSGERTTALSRGLAVRVQLFRSRHH